MTWKILVFLIGGPLQETGSKWKKVQGKSELSGGIWDCMRAIFSNFHFLLAVHGSPHRWQNESGNYEQELISSRKFQFRFKENARSWAKSIILQIHEASYMRGCLNLTVLKSLANLRNNQRCRPWSVVQVQDHNRHITVTREILTIIARSPNPVSTDTNQTPFIIFFCSFRNLRKLSVPFCRSWEHHIIFWYINNNFEIQTVKLRPHQTAGIQFLKSHFLQRIGLPSTPVNLLTEKWFKVRPVHTNHDISSWTVQIRVDGYGLNTLPYITLDKRSKISTFVFLHIQLEACAVLFGFSGKVICTTVLWINCLASKQTFI